jgi:anti-sigma regulatory factor (Ser/Thr protein kinase)
VSVLNLPFSHQLAFYDDADGFLASTVPYLREGLELDEPIFAALPPAKIELLRGELGADAEAVEFADIEILGRNPARLIPAWRDFLDTRALEGGGIRGIGESIWPARSPAAVDECERHESLLNLAFHDVPATAILCCYDSRALDDDVLDALHTLRAATGLEAAEAGFSEQRAADVVLAVAELAANSVIHGGGHGTATIWREPQALVVEVHDEGRIEQPLAGRVRPTPTQESGRGLWVANQVCDLVQIRSNAAGTRARLWMNLA